MQFASALGKSTYRSTTPVQTLLENRPRVVHSVTPDATVFSAIQKMSDERIGCLVVLASGRLAGILSERDYARKVILKGRNSQTTHVREIMNKPVLFVKPSESIDHALQMMTSHRIRHLPVLEGEEVIAVLSTSDLVSWLLESQQEAIDRLNSYIEADYPA